MNMLENRSEERLQIFNNIINYMDNANDCNNNIINNMIIDYERLYNRNFNTDYSIHMYSYLRHINIAQALFIYDNLEVKCRDNFIIAISEQHNHLKEILIVHETIKLIERCPDSEFVN